MFKEKLFEQSFEDGSLLVLNPSNTHWGILEDKRELEEYEEMKNGNKNDVYNFLIKNKIISDSGTHIKILSRICSGQNLLCVLHMTGKCNLACKYCYENDTKNDEFFTEELSFYLIDYLLDSNFKKISLVFHGGEPLLEFNLIKKIVSYAKSKDKNKRFLFSIQTNGTLITDEVVDFCKLNRISIGISIDGFKRVHDCFRKYKSGRGSLDQILNSIRMLKEKNKSFGVLSVISKRHIGKEKELLNFFADNGINSFRLNPLFASEKSVLYKDSLTADEYFNIIRNVFEGILEFRERGTHLNCLDITNLLENICTDNNGFRCLRNDCGAGFTFFGINPRGEVFPCGEFINIYEFKQGDIYSNSIQELQNSSVSQKIRLKTTENQFDCKSCPFRNICGGGCPGKSFFIKEDINYKSPMCDYYKKMIPYLMFKYKEDPSIIDLLKIKRGESK